MKTAVVLTGLLVALTINVNAYHSLFVLGDYVGDYDGDGKSDLAVYSNGYWSIYSVAKNAIILDNIGPWGGADWRTVAFWPNVF